MEIQPGWKPTVQPAPPPGGAVCMICSAPLPGRLSHRACARCEHEYELRDPFESSARYSTGSGES
jgi:hypothetical protein